MKETAKAKVAFNDYLGLGDSRSLEKLADQYQSRTDSPPTRQLSRLKRWSQVHGWQARLEEIAAAERAAIVARGIADRQNRVDALNDRWRRMQRVIEARADQHEKADLEASPAAGASSGLMVLTIKYLPSGSRVEEWAVDTGLLKELREHEKQAAQELGQWSEGKVDGLLKHIDLSKLTMEQLERLANGDDPAAVLLGR
ncbi:MAG: hypothetical protein ACYC4L_04695 [Chloroflexota bacterium]